MLKSSTSRMTSVKFIVAGAIVVLVASVCSWWHFVHNNPQHVFDHMLAVSLSAPSVTKQVNQTDNTQKLDQTTALLTMPGQQAHSAGILSQTGDTPTTVTTESLGTPAADFVRYTDIKTSQKNAQGGQFNFSNIIGLWGKADDSDPASGGAQLFNQTLLGIVPLADVRQPDRQALLKQIKNDKVYNITTSKVKHQRRNGRLVYTYDVNVVPQAYVTMLKTLAYDLGITQLEQLDPTQYAGSAPLKFSFDIDVWSGQLIKATYEDSGRVETYSAYGARTQTTVPSPTIPITELQTRLQQVQ